jgi:hypothetical protein
MMDIHKNNFTRSIFDELRRIVNLDDQSYRFTFDMFAGILALGERLLCRAFLLNHDNSRLKLSKDPVEQCDFDSLKRKLDGLRISDELRQLLTVI